ncbi:MAG: PEP-CTERM sorting domain-containing protein [Acidobacteriota bacterium]
MFRKITLAFVAAMSASSAWATVTFDFHTAIPSFGNAYGNSASFDGSDGAGGVQVTVTSFSLTGAGTTFETAKTSGTVNLGLNVCNQLEGLNCLLPQHQIDNDFGNGTFGAVDFILLQFNAPVSITSVTLSTVGDGNIFGTTDTDASFWQGNVASGLNLATACGGACTQASLAGLGFAVNGNSDAAPISNNSGLRTFNVGGGAYTSFLISARTGAGADSALDYFKLYDAVTESSTTPEPGTFGLGAAALIGLVALRRRALTR